MDDQFTIFVDDNHWLVAKARQSEVDIAPVDPPQDTDSVEAWAHATRQQMETMGYADQPVVLALPSPWCLTAVIDTDSIERVGRRQAMHYRLEEHLPIAAEQVVADYCEAADTAMGVCADLDRVKPIVNALESLGTQVRHVCPVAMLASAEALDHDNSLGAILLSDINGQANGRPARYDVIQLDRGKPTRWQWLADDVSDITDHLNPDNTDIASIGATTDPQLDNLPDTCRVVPIDNTDRYRSAAMRSARILAGTASPWVDLRRDGLGVVDRYDTYRKPVLLLAAAVAMLLISACVVMQMRGRHYNTEANNAFQQQVTIYEDLFREEGLKAPTVVERALKLKAQNMAGMSGQGADTAVTSLQSTSALNRYHAVLAALPTDIRFRITALTIEPDRITIDGEARSYGEAERIAASLRNNTPYDVEPQRTESISAGGVSFTFIATPASTEGGNP